MGRKSLIAVLLLPLPFAALPVAAVLLGHFEGTGTQELSIPPAGYESQLDVPSQPPERWSFTPVLQNHNEESLSRAQTQLTSGSVASPLC